jgi:hypothetical protein
MLVPAYNLAPDPRDLAVLGGVEDRLAAPGGGRWVVNARTGFLETQIPLTWCGTRIYRHVLGRDSVRVLHRPAQVEAKSFVSRLRLLPITPGHPALGGKSVDVDTTNARRFVIGQTGDAIVFATVPLLALDKVIGECRVPTARASVQDPAAISKITDPNRPHTQTSLGYLPLWATPPADERRDGPGDYPIGVFVSDHGPIEYDLEHVLDVDDPRVAALTEARPDFDSDKMGPNHLAAVLRQGEGRGDEASELLRLVDARDATGARSYFFRNAPTTQDADDMSEQKTIYNVRVGDVSPRGRAAAVKRGLAIPSFALDMENPELAGKLREIAAMVSGLAEELAGATAEGEALQGELDAGKVAATATEEELAAAKLAAAASEEKATDSAKLFAAQADELTQLRSLVLEGKRTELITRLGIGDSVAERTPEQVAAVAAIDASKTADALDRVTLVLLGICDSATAQDASPDYIRGALTVACSGKAQAPEPTPGRVADASPLGPLVRTGPRKVQTSTPGPMAALFANMNGTTPTPGADAGSN